MPPRKRETSLGGFLTSRPGVFGAPPPARRERTPKRPRLVAGGVFYSDRNAGGAAVADGRGGFRQVGVTMGAARGLSERGTSDDRNAPCASRPDRPDLDLDADRYGPAGRGFPTAAQAAPTPDRHRGRRQPQDPLGPDLGGRSDAVRPARRRDLVQAGQRQPAAGRPRPASGVRRERGRHARHGRRPGRGDEQVLLHLHRRRQGQRRARRASRSGSGAWTPPPRPPRSRP